MFGSVDLPVESNWFYLLPFLPWLREHDIKFRSAEVHDGSKLKKYLVTLQNFPDEFANEAGDLTNILLNLLRNVIPILNGNKANSVGGFSASKNIDWLKAYTRGTVADLEVVKDRVEEELNQLRNSTDCN